MSYSLIDIIKNGKPGEVYKAIPLPSLTIGARIEIDKNGCLIDMEDDTYLSHSYLVNAIKEGMIFDRIKPPETQIKNIIYKYVDEDNGDIEKLYDELKCYFKEEL